MTSAVKKWQSIWLRWETRSGRALNDYVRGDNANTVEEYFRNLQRSWTARLAQRSIIYLDQSIWIEFQKARAGEKSRDGSALIYEKLSEAVRTGKAICPISSASYWELLKQADFKTKMETAAVMDELSLGFTVAGTLEVLKIELDNLFDGKIDTFDKVWQRVGFVEVLPSPMEFLKGEMNQLQFRKFLIELQSEMNLQELVELLPLDSSIVDRMEADITTELKRIKVEDPKINYKGFDQLFAFEFASLVKSIMTDVFRDHFENKRYGPMPDLIELIHSRERIRSTIPFIYATASLQAMLRWDANRKYHDTDYFDVQHSAFGLAFCDVLLTERGFGALLRMGPKNLASFYETTVLSDQTAMVAYVTSGAP